MRVNAIAPMARTRLTESMPGLAERMAEPADAGAFDAWHPANVSPVVAWLASRAARSPGEVFYVHGTTVRAASSRGRWTTRGSWWGRALDGRRLEAAWAGLATLDATR